MNLYHVTGAKNVDSILKNGLLPWKFRERRMNQSWNKIFGPGTVGKSGIYCSYYPDRLTKTFSDDMRLVVMRIPDNEFLNMNKHAGDYLYHRNWSDDQYYRFATTAWNDCHERQISVQEYRSQSHPYEWFSPKYTVVILDAIDPKYIIKVVDHDTWFNAIAEGGPLFQALTRG